MGEAWPHLQLFLGERVVCHIGRQLYWKRKNLRLVISFGFVHHKKKGNAKEAKEK